MEEGPALLASKLPLPMKMGGNGPTRPTPACCGEVKRGHPCSPTPHPRPPAHVIVPWCPHIQAPRPHAAAAAAAAAAGAGAAWCCC